MKQIIDFKIHNFPQVPDKKVKVKIGKLDLSGSKEFKLFK